MYILYIIVLKIKLITNLHALSVAIHVLANKRFVIVVNNLSYRQRLNERVGPTLGYVSLEIKQLAENSTVCTVLR